MRVFYKTLALWGLLLVPVFSQAQVINVDPAEVNFNLGDGLCSLYEAAQSIIDGAAADAACDMPGPGLNTISLAPGSIYELDTDHDLDNVYVPVSSFNLAGNGAVIMRAVAAPEISFIRFDVGSMGSISNVRLANSGNGTALDVFAADITIDTVDFINNGFGINMLNASGTQIRNSTFRGTGSEAGLISTASNYLIGNTTFSGLAVALTMTNDIAALNNLTIANNGIGISAASANGIIANSIIANSINRDCDGDAGDQLQSAGFNISSDAFNTCFLAGPGDLINVDPMLGPLADNGAFSPNHLPQTGSPVIDGSQNFTAVCENNDQRGIPRPQDGDGDLIADCDIGSIEVMLPNLDLSVTSMVDMPSANPGDMVTFTLTVFNAGPAADQMASVINFFSADLMNISWTCMPVAPSTCTAMGNGVINDNAAIASGGMVVYTASAEIGPAPAGDIMVTSTVMSSLFDVMPGNNSASSTIMVGAPNFDLSISKTDNVVNALPGDNLTYTITVDHFGDAPVAVATVTDIFPVGLENISWTCSASPGTNCPPVGTGDINVPVTAINPGSQVVFTVDAQVDEMFTGNLSNTASLMVELPEVDPNLTNNSATDDTLVVTVEADLFISKSVDLQSVDPGQVLTYTVTAGQNAISNRQYQDTRGGAGVVAATIVDIIPEQLSEVSWTCVAEANSQCPEVGFGDIDVTVGIAENEQVVFTISGMVKLDASGDINNQASVVLPPEILDPDLSNNFSSVITSLNRAFDLAISKTDNRDINSPGGDVSYVITVNNNGTSDMSATVVDELPEVLQNVSWICAADENASCAESGSGNIAEVVQIASGGTLVFEVSATIIAGFEGELENTATVTPQPDFIDQFPNDNTATDSTEVIARSGLRLSKTGPANAASFTTAEFVVTVANSGPSDALQLVLDDHWQAGLQLRNIDSGAFVCGPEVDNSVQCLADELAADASEVLRFTFFVSADTNSVLSNTARVMSTTPDPDASDNQAVAAVTVTPELILLPGESQLVNGTVGEDYLIVFSTIGGIAPIQFSVDNVPPGLSTELLNGELVMAGIPELAGIFQIKVTIQDSTGVPQVKQRVYSLQITTELQLEPESLPTANTDEAYLAQIIPANGVPPYAVEIAGLPAGLTHSNGVIQGLPQTAGEFDLQVAALDNQGNTGERGYTLRIDSGLQLPQQALPQSVLGVSYGQQLFANGGISPNSWSGGDGLPSGLSLSDTGFISGLAQTSGEFNFSATVTDDAGAQATRQFVLTVSMQALTQQETIFPDGLIGLPYQSPTAIAGGQQPYDCEVIQASLPPGLILNGCNSGIAGTPSQAGSFRFVLGIQDNQQPSQTLLLPARIQIAEQTPIPIELPPELDFQPPANVPVPEFGIGSPADGFADESLQAVAIDAFGNRYLAGFGWNGNNYDIRILKYNARGGLIWEQRFDSGEHDYAYAVSISRLDQQLYVGGYSLQGSQFVATLLRYDLAGVLQQTIFDNLNSPVKAYYALQADTAGVYAIGESYNGRDFDGLVVRYDHAGNRLFQALQDNGDSETAYAAALNNCDDNGVCDLVIGGFQGDVAPTGWLASVSRTGGSVQMLAQIPDSIFALQPFANGDWLLGSSSNSNDWVIRRVTAAGTGIWATTVNQGERLRGLAIDQGGFVLAAGSASGPGTSDGLLVSLDAQGQQLNSMTFDMGVSELFTGSLIGPEGVLTLVGERSILNDTRFLVLNLNTGKAF